MTTLTTLATCCALAFIYFAYHIAVMHSDWDAAFKQFQNKHYPTIAERKAYGRSLLQKSFRQYVVGYYFCAALCGYGFYHLLTKILEKVL